MDGPGQPAAWSGADYSTHADHHRTLDDWFLDRHRPGPADVVVDLGSGSGEFSARLADLVPDGRVVGIEPDLSMLEAARRHTKPNLTFLNAAAENFDESMDEASVDVVVSRAMLHWLPPASYPRVFSAVFRVLRPGGWFHAESGGAGNVPKVLGLIDDLADEFGVPRMPRFPDAGVAFDLVEEAGFDVHADGVRTVAQRRAFSRDEIVGFVRSQATVALTRAAPEGTAETIRNAAVAHVDRLRRADGTFDQTFVRLEILAQRPR